MKVSNRKFARIIEVDGKQVLFYTEPDHEYDGCELVHQIVNLKGVQADIKLGGVTYKNVDKFWKLLDEAHARKVVETVETMLFTKKKEK